jgi:hypothetical protein
MFRSEGVPVYGHVGVRFDARSAQLVQSLRDRRFRDVFDKMLLRCTKQIQNDVQMSKDSSVFVVPEFLHGDLTPYNVADIISYLTVALRDDRGYTVIQINANTLYIRWSRPLPASEPAPPPEFHDYIGAPKKAAAAAPTKITYVHAGVGKKKKGGGGDGDIDRLLHSLNI